MLAVASNIGFDELVAHQREILDDYWEHADVKLDGDDELQQAVRLRAVPASCRPRRAAEGHGIAGEG